MTPEQIQDGSQRAAVPASISHTGAAGVQVKGTLSALRMILYSIIVYGNRSMTVHCISVIIALYLQLLNLFTIYIYMKNIS